MLGAAPQSARCVSSCIDTRKRLLCMVFCPPRPTPSAVRDGPTTCSGEPPAGHGRSSVDHACLGRQLVMAKTQVQSCYHPKPYHRRSIWGRTAPRCVADANQARPSLEYSSSLLILSSTCMHQPGDTSPPDIRGTRSLYTVIYLPLSLHDHTSAHAALAPIGHLGRAPRPY